MNNISFKLFFAFFLSVILMSISCEDQLELPPQGLTSESTLDNEIGIRGYLIGAYSMLDGVGADTGEVWSTDVGNWVYGGVASDDAHKGSSDGDQGGAAEIMRWSTNPTNSYFNNKWRSLYESINRSNDVIRALERIDAGVFTDTEMKQIKAEAVFLRAVYHLEAAKLWRNVPYIDETVTYAADNYNVENDGPIWSLIEADFRYAAENLPAIQTEIGRANSWAAKSFLAKTYMFDGKFAEARLLLEDVITKGINSAGTKYALTKSFADTFNPSFNNGSESVFAAQMTVNDGSNGANGNNGYRLNTPYGGLTSCCGFYQPSFSLVNSFKTDPVTGLPFLDTWNDSDVKNDYGLMSTDPFTPETGTLDPRLDYTVGRRGIPMLDWGVMPGQAWVRAPIQGGPYLAIKRLFYKEEAGTTTESSQPLGAKRNTNNNYEIIRFADVILWAAECEIEVGSLDKAEEYVNMIRNRAADKDGWVEADVAGGSADYGGYAANYFVKPYPAGSFAGGGKDYARKAVRFERKLELAMEGHRFFDLQRYDNGSGYMANVLNAYAKHEGDLGIPILQGAQFTQGKSELFPIPQNQIDLSTKGRDGVSALKQNPGY